MADKIRDIEKRMRLIVERICSGKLNKKAELLKKELILLTTPRPKLKDPKKRIREIKAKLKKICADIRGLYDELADLRVEKERRSTSKEIDTRAIDAQMRRLVKAFSKEHSRINERLTDVCDAIREYDIEIEVEKRLVKRLGQKLDIEKVREICEKRMNLRQEKARLYAECDANTIEYRKNRDTLKDRKQFGDYLEKCG